MISLAPVQENEARADGKVIDPVKVSPISFSNIRLNVWKYSITADDDTIVIRGISLTNSDENYFIEIQSVEDDYKIEILYTPNLLGPRGDRSTELWLPSIEPVLAKIEGLDPEQAQEISRRFMEAEFSVSEET